MFRPSGRHESPEDSASERPYVAGVTWLERGALLVRSIQCVVLAFVLLATSSAGCTTARAPVASQDVCAVIEAALRDVVTTSSPGQGGPTPGEISDVSLPAYQLRVSASLTPQGAWSRADLRTCPSVVSTIARSKFRLSHGRRVRPGLRPPLYWFSSPKFSEDGLRANLAFTDGSGFSGWLYEANRTPTGERTLNPKESDMWVTTALRRQPELRASGAWTS
jgi:hypothetical protein